MSNRTQIEQNFSVRDFACFISQTFFFQFISNHFELENVVKMTPETSFVLTRVIFYLFLYN